MTALRVSFPAATNVLAAAMLVVLLTGCASTAQQHQYRKGDFVSNVASTEAGAHVATAAAPGERA